MTKDWEELDQWNKNQHGPESWEERFEEKFVPTTKGMTWDPDYEDLKAFIAQELTRAKKEVAEEMIAELKLLSRIPSNSNLETAAELLANKYLKE